jgi:phosphoglycerate kinase
MNKLKVQDLDVRGKKVLLRVEFNVPQDSEGNITDETRIRESLPTIQHLLQQGSAVILLSHLGRPKKGRDPTLSLAPCAKVLADLLKQPVLMAPDSIGPEVQQLAESLENGQVLLLENLRFYPAEEDPKLDLSFAKKLASLGDFFVNDAFGGAHRDHSSTVTIAEYFPGKAAAGLLMQKETDALERLLLDPKRPFYALIGGAKISSKIGFLRALADKADALFIGGGMSYPLLKAQGIEIGDSICDPASISIAEEFVAHCEKKQLPLFLPTDLVIADRFSNDAHRQIVSVEQESSQGIPQGVPSGWQGMDIGPQTIHEWKFLLKKAASIFWNGPVGVFEFPHFSHGTDEIARTIADLPALTVVGGGDSTAAINRLHLSSHFTHVSTGGGASLEFIEKGSLPGIEALSST